VREKQTSILTTTISATSCCRGIVLTLCKPNKSRWHSFSVVLFSAMLLLFSEIGWGQQTITKFAGTGSIDLYSDWRNIDWLNPNRVTSNDNNYATVNLSVGENSGYLKSSNYNLNVPTGSTILGIELTIGRYSSSFFATRIQDIAVSLLKYNNIIGVNKAVTGTNWPSSETAITYGGPTDLWGTTWNSDEINSNGFGAILQVYNSAALFSFTAYVDYMQITVYYNPPSILFSSSNPAVPAASIAKNSSKQPIYHFTAEGVGQGANMTQLVFTVDGTSLANDISSYQVYYSSSSSSLADANSVSNPLTTIPASGALVTIPIYSPYIGDGTTCYFWICADIKPNATIGNTITVQAVATSNVTLSTAIDKTGTMYVGGMQTIGSGPTITSFSPTSACSESNTTVTINGTKLNKTTSVAFNGTLSSSISIVNNNQITALLPVSATTGPITVTTDNGSVTSSTDFTINPLPTAVTVSGSGTYCGSATITASGGTGGTIYYQGTTSGGTSTTTPLSSQSITTSGTYYFRSQSASGCWGPEGSATVTINPLPTPTFTVVPYTSECQGDDVTYTTQSGMSNYMWSVPGTSGSDYSITLGGIGAGSNTVTLKWLTTGSKTVTVGYTGGNGCASATPASSTITVNPTPVIGTFN